MNRPRWPHATPALAAALLACAAVQAQPVPAPKPGDEQPRADVMRPQPAGLRPLGPGTAPATAPHLLTAPARPVNPTGPVVTPGSGETKPRIVKRHRATGDDDEMDDLDIQRRKLQGLPANRPDAPPKRIKPGDEQGRDRHVPKGN